MNPIQSLLHRPFFIRLFNWEYWSFAMVYTLIYPIWILIGIRSRSFFFFAAANPKILNGGFLNESKKDVHALVPDELQPKTIHFSIPANADLVLQELARNGLAFPMIGKPDVGGRGRGIKVLKEEQDVRSYVSNAYLDFHIQEFVPYKKEIGVFYYRNPGEAKGKITGIVRKEFLTVTGNGKDSIREILKRDKRALMYLSSFENMHGKKLDEVLADGDKRIVSPYGNHARGAMFIDDSHLVDEAFINFIDSICQRIPEFYFGRLDIRYRDWEELKQGINFSIIEVNGAGSEPTHIYDPRHSIFFAWKEIIRHWIILARVSRKNRKRGYPYLTVRQGIQMFREDKLWSKKLAAMPE